MTRDPRAQMKSALAAHRSAASNEKALVYAPWVLNLMLAVAVKDTASLLEVSHWVAFFAYVCTLPVLGRMARKAIARQREQAELVIEGLVRTPRGFDDLRRLQSEPRYARLQFSDRLRHAIVTAAMMQARALEERQDQERHMGRERRRELARV